MMKMKKFILWALLLPMFSIKSSPAAVLTFEDLYSDYGTYDYLPSSYGGFNWSQYSGFITKNYTSLPGYVNGTVDNVSLFTIGANDIDLTRDINFDFLGAYVNIHYNSPARSVTFEGLLDGVNKYTETLTFSDPYPLSWFGFNFLNIDQLVIHSDEYVVIDNFEYSDVSTVAESNTLLLTVCTWCFWFNLISIVL